MNQVIVKIPNLLIVGMLVALISAPLSAQPTSRPAVNDVMLPELKFNDIRFDDMIAFVRDASGLNIVVKRTPGVKADYPAVGNIHLKNVTVGQFLTFVEKTYAVPVERIDGPAGPLYVIVVDPNLFSSGGQRAQLVSVGVFDLGDAISTLKARRAGSDDKSDPLKDVMSLIQAALDQNGDDPKPVLTVHAATQTLIFKGTNRSNNLIRSTLDALHSEKNSDDTLKMMAAIREAFGHMPDPNSRDAVDIQILNNRLIQLKKLENENAELRLEIDRMKKASAK